MTISDELLTLDNRADKVSAIPSRLYINSHSYTIHVIVLNTDISVIALIIFIHLSLDVCMHMEIGIVEFIVIVIVIGCNSNFVK